ncbi:hypothetical protein PCC9214_03972 [Planktothrix tepida]|uniref:DUF2949 domain-containing protein n=2 Tax=Planktothrix TaxID=54304 RepID=A0A1J1LP12_9CYAN|nr:DUF2949 domain-containing protein [Planktothrix tepida]CAD5937040.1 hypothetical protein NO713_01667 [Planktothrix pseudagardhii]CAD5973326.1 hypothetical protein PCC9214_03972 [Planktothrix tepida]CUR33982.1 conserved hypothetical protein [Planktothrix tepida PCC 9214]
MISPKQAQLIQFLRWELAIPASSIAMALRHPEQDSGQLPMILWQYGLITLEQLDRIFDWLERFGSIMETKPTLYPHPDLCESSRTETVNLSASLVA